MVGAGWQMYLSGIKICPWALCNYRLTPCELSCYKSEVLSGFFGSGCSDCCCRNGFREFPGTLERI